MKTGRTHRKLGAFLTEFIDHDALPNDAVAEGAAAYTRYSETPDSEIITVHPDGFAIAVPLTSMKMMTVTLGAVPQNVLAIASAATDLASYMLLVFGKPSRTPNHSIQEYC